MFINNRRELDLALVRERALVRTNKTLLRVANYYRLESNKNSDKLDNYAVIEGNILIQSNTLNDANKRIEKLERLIQQLREEKTDLTLSYPQSATVPQSAGGETAEGTLEDGELSGGNDEQSVKPEPVVHPDDDPDDAHGPPPSPQSPDYTSSLHTVYSSAPTSRPTPNEL